MTTADTTTEDTQVAQLRERVIAGLEAAGVTGPFGTLEPMLGGHSGLTYRISGASELFVIKAVPPGQKAIGRHDMLRQARIMTALADTNVPVPGIRATDESGHEKSFSVHRITGATLEA